MDDAAFRRLTGSMTMCRKAGKLLLGFDAVKDALQKHQIHLVLLAADASPKTEKEIRFFAGEIPVRRLPADMDTLKAYFRKRTAVFGVSEAGFAGTMLAALPDQPAADSAAVSS